EACLRVLRIGLDLTKPRIKRFDLVVARACRSEFGGSGLNDQPDFTQVAHEQIVNASLTQPAEQISIHKIPFSSRSDAHSRLGANLNQALRGQYLNRFTQHCAADAKMSGQINFGREPRSPLPD